MDCHLYVKHHYNLHKERLGDFCHTRFASLWGGGCQEVSGPLWSRGLKRCTVSQRLCDCHRRRADVIQPWRNDTLANRWSMGFSFPFVSHTRAMKSLRPSQNASVPERHFPNWMEMFHVHRPGPSNLSEIQSPRGLRTDQASSCCWVLLCDV